MDAVSSLKHKHRRGITFVIVSRYHFRGNTEEQASRYYRSVRFQYRGIPVVPIPCSSLIDTNLLL